MPQAITINISDALYEQLHQAALLFRRSTETIITESLRHTLPPLFEEIPPDYQSAVFPLLFMSDQELLHEATQTFPQEKWLIYESLLESKKNSELTTKEEETLARLRYEADCLTFRRSYAMVLLQRRGYRSPLKPQ